MREFRIHVTYTHHRFKIDGRKIDDAMIFFGGGGGIKNVFRAKVFMHCLEINFVFITY